ncbi:MAG: hypothetical protein AB1540_08420 [Bdellovibrionota bacterium]
MIKKLSFMLVVLMGLQGMGCGRSKAYKTEQDYYRHDTAYGNRGGTATARADRFGQPKKKLYVLPFYNATPLGGEELGFFAASELLREVRSTAKAVVPEDIRSGDTSKDFYSGDKVRLGPLVREGKRLGVSLLVIGKIKKIVYRTKGDEVGLFRQKKSIAAVDLEMRIFDINNAKEILFDEKSADSTASQVDIFGSEDSDPKSQRLELVRMALRSGMKLFSTDTTRTLEKISWEGRIAKISNGKVFINAGRATGLSVGDILKVLTPGEDIYDPVTGAYMGRSAGQPKGTLEVTDYFGTDGAAAAIHSGGNFTENDVVQLY